MREERERERDAERARRAEALARLQEYEAAMVEEAVAREVAAAAAREAAGLLLSVAELVRGETLPPVQATALPRQVLVRKTIRGRELVLYRMPWAAAECAA